MAGRLRLRVAWQSMGSAAAMPGQYGGHVAGDAYLPDGSTVEDSVLRDWDRHLQLGSAALHTVAGFAARRPRGAGPARCPPPRRARRCGHVRVVGVADSSLSIRMASSATCAGTHKSSWAWLRERYQLRP